MFIYVFCSLLLFIMFVVCMQKERKGTKRKGKEKMLSLVYKFCSEFIVYNVVSYSLFFRQDYQHFFAFQCEVESNKQNAARQSALIQSLRDRVHDAEDAAVDKENMASRNDVTIISLRKEMLSQQDRLQQVESSLKHHISAEEEAANRAIQWESKVHI